MSNVGQGVVFGQRPGGTSAQTLVGYMGEVILCSSAMDYQKHQGYLAHKWGLEANLPGGHPYKAASPA